ncbi:MAG: TetR/AcrR family transcriptional regulator [Anaerolineae bacterium]|nr:TetR/AcrR family transcriptional regulator [Anaerolineae bacterium]
MVKGDSQEELQPAADETRFRLLEAAAQLFAERGYARATTRELAAAAGVNEVTLFRHFGSKKNLFAAVVEHYASPSLDAALEIQPGGDYRQDLVVMGRQVMDLMLERRDAMRLMLCEAEHFPEVGEVLAHNPRRLRRALSTYLQEKMQRGEVRMLHADAAAQAFWGMFFAYSVSLGLLDEEVRPELSVEEVVDHFVDIFVLGTRACP